MRYISDHLVGTGAALNVPLGFVPSYVRLWNRTDGNLMWEASMFDVVDFDGGGNTVADPREIRPQMLIHAADDGWSGRVRSVLRRSGSWQQGTAAGWIVFEQGSIEGRANFADNDKIRIAPYHGVRGADDAATLNGAGIGSMTLKIDPENANAASRMSIGGANEQITAYYGKEGEIEEGFTLGSSISANDKLLVFQAWAEDPGSAPVYMR